MSAGVLIEKVLRLRCRSSLYKDLAFRKLLTGADAIALRKISLSIFLFPLSLSLSLFLSFSLSLCFNREVQCSVCRVCSRTFVWACEEASMKFGNLMCHRHAMIRPGPLRCQTLSSKDLMLAIHGAMTLVVPLAPLHH